MNLTGKQQRELHIALLAAFPTATALERMVKYQLDKNLSEIASGESNLEDIIFRLIRWADTYGRVSDLLQGSLDANSTNPVLKTTVARLQSVMALEPLPVEKNPAGVMEPVLEVQFQRALQTEYERQQKVQLQTRQQHELHESILYMDNFLFTGAFIFSFFLALVPGTWLSYSLILWPIGALLLRLWSAKRQGQDVRRVLISGLLRTIVVFVVVFAGVSMVLHWSPTVPDPFSRRITPTTSR